MKPLKLVFLSALFFVPATAQQSDHAPTVEQCRADVALWFDPSEAAAYLKAETAHINDGVPNRTAIAKLPLDKVLDRLDEMRDCWKVDGKNDRYYEALRFYSNVQSDRYAGFIRRHHLMSQLRREDAQGLR